MKSVYNITITVIIFGLLLVVESCKKRPDIPVLITENVSAITTTTATTGGNVTNDGGAEITTRGVCWDTNENPTIEMNKTSDGSGTGSFTSNLSGLTQGTIYFVRAYATNNEGTGYGNQVSFTTNQAVLATITTTVVSGITSTSAVSGGEITNNGGAQIVSRGICWSTNPNPTTSNNKTSDGSGDGSFTSNISGLTAITLYYVRAYATNSAGTSYGNEISFATVGLPSIVTYSINNLSSTFASSGGNITNNGGSPIIGRGVCWSTAPNPDLTDSHTTDGSGTGSFNSNLTNLLPATVYYLRAYATNNIGTAYGSEKVFTTTILVTDVDGNEYNTIQIGTQLWLRENLKVVHYQDGSPINHVSDNTSWSELNTGAYCNYNNDESNVATYGRLYNWYTTSDSRKLCPANWHIPSNTEWDMMIEYLGGKSVAGGKMKEDGYNHWQSPNAGATNESGFNGLPGGLRSMQGPYQDLGSSANFWSNYSYIGTGRGYSLWHTIQEVFITGYGMTTGFSVRCIKD